MPPDLMRPVLEAHGEGERLRLDEIASRLVIPVFSWDSDDLADQQASGDVTVTQRVGWARTYLEHGGLLERPSRGETSITSRGLEVVRPGKSVPVPRSDWSTKPISRRSVLAAIEAFKADRRDSKATCPHVITGRSTHAP